MKNYFVYWLIREYFLLLLILSSCVLPFDALSEQQMIVSGLELQESDIELYERAISLKKSDAKQSMKLARQALNVSIASHNDLVTAKSHLLLAELNKQFNQKEQVRLHFYQAALFFNKVAEYEEELNASKEYVQISLKAKHYLDVRNEVDRVLPVALKHAESKYIGVLLMRKAESYYKQKSYKLAITEYLRALDYFNGQEKSVKRKLGDTYKMLAQSYKRLNNNEKVAYFYEKALIVYSSINNKKAMARTLNTLAEVQRKLGNLIIALDYSKRSLEIHRQIDDKDGLGKALNGAGIIYRNIGLYEKSLEHVHEAHRIFKELGLIENIAKTSNQMGLIYTRLKQFEQAKSFYQLTIDLPTNKLEPKTVASAKREMAVILQDSGEYQAARAMAKKAYQVYKESNSHDKASLTARVIGNTYRAESDFKHAKEYYRLSLDLAKKADSKIYQVKAQTRLASLLIGEDDDKAVSLLLESLDIAKQIKENQQVLYAIRELRKTEKSRGDFGRALDYAEEEIELTKLIQKEREEADIVVVKAKLHSHKIEMDLVSLQEKNKFNQLQLEKKNNEIEMAEQAHKIADLELSKKRYTNGFLLIGILICLLVVFYINRRFIHSRKQNKELGYLAERDPLTSCYNRRILFEVLSRGLMSSDLHDDYCVMMVDIDHFKMVNDTHGHSVGDKVLCGVADTLRAAMRSSDITTRYGGEEFCIVLADISIDQILLLAESLREKIQVAVFEGIKVTCSFGITSIKFGALTPAELIDQADAALYQSKSNGRNRVTLWQGETALKGD